MFNVTANPDKYDEAISYFQTRVPMLKKDWLALEESARKSAFTVAGVQRLDVIQDVLNALEKAVEDGETVEEFKGRIAAKLAAEWGRDNPARVELIFQNGVQHAYNAGRYELATHPDVLLARPYWMFDAILDTRTTPVCRAADGTVLAHDDTFWSSHYPPLHHRCRSSVRTLTDAQARAEGIAETPPVHPAQDGFGHLPDVKGYTPNPADYADELADAFAAVIGPPPPLTGAQVRDRLATLSEDFDKTTDAVKAADKAAQDHYFTFYSDGPNALHLHPDWSIEEFRAMKTAALEAWEKTQAARAAHVALRGADARAFLNAPAPLELNAVVASKVKKATAAHWEAGVQAFKDLIGPQPAAIGDPYKVLLKRLPPKGRAYYMQSELSVHVTEAQSLDVIVHELGHWFEYNVPGMLDKSRKFYARRTLGEQLTKLSKLQPGYRYGADEIAKADKFISPYTGKFYGNRVTGEQRATELFSMGLQYMYDDALAFAKADPDHFDFIWHAIRGLDYD